MRALHWIVAAAFAAAVPATAMAQDPSSQPPPAQTTTTADQTTEIGIPSHWTASGFVGSNFGLAANEASWNFGGQVGYLYRGIVGGEFLADFAPNFALNNALLADNPAVNSYMGNVIGALPLGIDGRFQPYVSGGLGGIQLRSSVLNVAATPASGSTSSDEMKFGGDIGAGILAFAGNVGVRGDVRYYRAFSSSVSSGANPADATTQTLLSGLDFWRANVGVALRW